MTAGPTVSEILSAVAQWIDDGATGATGFHGKVASNALAIARRDIEDWPAAEERAAARLRDITDRDGTFSELESVLCAMLRDGEIDPREPRVLDHLRATTRDRLAIDQPAYRSLLR